MPREGKTSSRAFATSAVEKSGSGSGLDALAKRRLSARAVRHKFKKAFRNPLSVSEEPGLLQSATENRHHRGVRGGVLQCASAECFQMQPVPRAGCPNLAAMVLHKTRTLQTKKRGQVHPADVFGPGRQGAGKNWPKFRQARVYPVRPDPGWGSGHNSLAATNHGSRAPTKKRNQMAAKGGPGRQQCEQRSATSNSG